MASKEEKGILHAWIFKRYCIIWEEINLSVQLINLSNFLIKEIKWPSNHSLLYVVITLFQLKYKTLF